MCIYGHSHFYDEAFLFSRYLSFLRKKLGLSLSGFDASHWWEVKRGWEQRSEMNWRWRNFNWLAWDVIEPRKSCALNRFDGFLHDPTIWVVWLIDWLTGFTIIQQWNSGDREWEEKRYFAGPANSFIWLWGWLENVYKMQNEMMVLGRWYFT